MPEGFHPFTSCSSIPVFIHGRLIKSPLSCHSEAFQREEPATDEDGNQITRNVTRTITRAEWMVDFDEVDCIPRWDENPGQPIPIPDDSCHDYGVRVYHSYMTASRVPSGLDPLEACRKTPAVIDGVQLYPDRCEERFADGGEPIMYARFLAKEARNCGGTPGKQCLCTPSWDAEPVPEQFCHDYATRIYTASISQLPPDIDPVSACQKTRIVILGRQFYPYQCSMDVNGSEGSTIHPVVRAQFMVTDEPSCKAVWSRPVKDDTCTEYGIKRYTSFLEKIPSGLDGMEMCWIMSQVFSGEEKKPNLCQKVALPDGSEKIVASWMISRDVPECYTHLQDLERKASIL
ncbi:hypothetical protein VNI00_006223 [Paramarasmius palmivorus]|uniref:Uncharacterized protein n=1 Tax=Paramarasmius palmivorus TaxID=297713 RepID=A0AAW0D7T3_9AGAR